MIEAEEKNPKNWTTRVCVGCHTKYPELVTNWKELEEKIPFCNDCKGKEF